MIYLLQYHKILPGYEIGGTFVTPKIFEHHLREIKSLNLKSLDNLNFHSVLLHPENFKENYILITFDDGYENIYKYAFPLLEKYGLKAAVFPVAGYIGNINHWEVPFLGRHSHLSRSQIRELHKSGWIIGSHTLTHPDLRSLNPDRLKKELEESKEILEDIIGESVISMSYPYGLFNKTVKRAVREAGYKIAFKSSGNIKFPLDPLEVPRRSVYIIDFSIKAKFDPFYSSFTGILEKISNNFAKLSPLYHRLFTKS